MEDLENSSSSAPSPVPRLPLSARRHNSLQLPNWTAAMALPAEKRAPVRQKSQQKPAEKEHAGDQPEAALNELRMAGCPPATSGHHMQPADAGPQAAEDGMKTPGRAARPPQQLACGPPPTPSLLSPLASPLQRTGVRGPPQRIATPAAAQRDRLARPQPPPQPFALMSPRMDSTQHMAHQRAAADAEKLQRQRLPRAADAARATRDTVSRTPRATAAAAPGEMAGPPADDRGQTGPAAVGGHDDVGGDAASRAAAADAADAEAAAPQGSPRAVSPEELDLIEVAQTDEAETAGDQEMAVTPARRLEGSLPHRTPLGQPQRIPDASVRPPRMRELKQLTVGGADTAAAQAGTALGSFSLLSPVRSRPGRTQPQVATPVRRSARMTAAAPPVASVMESTGFAYAPNTVVMPGGAGDAAPGAQSGVGAQSRRVGLMCTSSATDGTNDADAAVLATAAAGISAAPQLTVDIDAATTPPPATAVASPATATPSPVPAGSLASPATPVEGFARRVTRQMSALKAKMLASATKSGSEDTGSACKPSSPSMSPTEQTIRRTLLRSARKKRQS